MSQIQEDINLFIHNFKHNSLLSGSTVCITGGTGFIGSMMTRCLLALKCEIKLSLPVRNISKVADDIKKSEWVELIEIDNLIKWSSETHLDYDYMIHCASPTSGNIMVQYPVETFNLAYQTMYNILEYAKKHRFRGITYLSSIEVYGQNNNNKLLNENDFCFIDITNPRNCYPLGKQAVEHLCKMYSYEYNIPVKVARLTQTFGAGISMNDNRVFAQFSHSIVRGDDIMIHTSGESSKPYCYSIDCIMAIMQILLFGKNGETYNVANKNTYISINNLALFLKHTFNPSVRIVYMKNEGTSYAPTTKLNMNTDKLEQLGWKPLFGLEEMFKRLINYIKEESHGRFDN